MALYARAITLRNCGRFTVIASDFGADYRTHTHVTSQALYASMTRGKTWRAGGTQDKKPVYPYFTIKADHYDFESDYDVSTLPVWFTPGLFKIKAALHLPDSELDAGYFNVVQELYPSTSQKYGFKRQRLVRSKRPPHVHTYGRWQSILPDHRMHTIGLAYNPTLLENFQVGQTYLLGKKRTMMQIMALSEITSGQPKQGICQTAMLQIKPDDIQNFHSFQVVAATMRYLILHGETRDEDDYVQFELQSVLGNQPVALPGFYLRHIPIK